MAAQENAAGSAESASRTASGKEATCLIGQGDRPLERGVNVQGDGMLGEKLIGSGAGVVRHAKYVTFQMAEVAVVGELFVAILERIQRFGVPTALVQRG